MAVRRWAMRECHLKPTSHWVLTFFARHCKLYGNANFCFCEIWTSVSVRNHIQRGPQISPRAFSPSAFSVGRSQTLSLTFKNVSIGRVADDNNLHHFWHVGECVKTASPSITCTSRQFKLSLAASQTEKKVLNTGYKGLSKTQSHWQLIPRADEPKRIINNDQPYE